MTSAIITLQNVVHHLARQYLIFDGYTYDSQVFTASTHLFGWRKNNFRVLPGENVIL
jgi:hypothetical protein